MPRPMRDLLADPPWPMRQDDWQAAGVALDQRAVMYGTGMVKRRQSGNGALGRYILDRAKVGDVLPGLWWDNESEGKRPVGAWRWGAWPAKRAYTDAGEAGSLPVEDRYGAVDTGFKPALVPEREDGQRRPIGARFWVTAASDTESEEPVAIDEGSLLIAQWNGPSRDEYSAVVRDIAYATKPDGTKDSEGELDPFGARLNTAMGLIDKPQPAGSKPKKIPVRNLAWNLTAQFGGDAGGYGACIGGVGLQRDAYRGHRVCYASSLRSGPLMTLPAGDAHMGAAVTRGMPAGPMGLSLGALFSDGGRTAPLEVKGDYPETVAHGVPVEVNLTYDKEANHAWVDPMGQPRVAKGRWKWHSWGLFQPPTTPPVTPPTETPPRVPVIRTPPTKRPPGKPPVITGRGGKAGTVTGPIDQGGTGTGTATTTGKKLPTDPKARKAALLKILDQQRKLVAGSQAAAASDIVDAENSLQATLDSEEARLKAQKIKLRRVAKEQRALLDAANTPAGRKARLLAALAENKRLAEKAQGAADIAADARLSAQQVLVASRKRHEEFKAQQKALRIAAAAARVAVRGGIGAAAAGAYGQSIPALTQVAISSPSLVGIPSISPSGRFVQRFGVLEPGDVPPSSWVANTVAQHARRNETGERTWIRVQPAGKYAPPNGTAKGGLAFAPADRDTDPDVMPGEVASARAAHDTHLAAVSGAGLAVAAEINPTTGKVVSGLRIRRDSSGEVTMSMVNASGVDDPGEPALKFAAFTTFEGGINVPVLSIANNVVVDRSQAVVALDTASNPRAVTMPDTAECTRMLWLSNTGSAGNDVTLTAAGSDVFAENGTGSLVISDGGSKTLASDGAGQWLNVSGGSGGSSSAGTDAYAFTWMMA